MKNIACGNTAPCYNPPNFALARQRCSHGWKRRQNSARRDMKTSLLLLACACTLGQPTNRSEWQLTPQLAPGQELVYTGSYTEESLVPNVHFQRQYRLE